MTIRERERREAETQGELEELRAEVERLRYDRVAIDRWSAERIGYIAQLEAEVERLREALRDIRDNYDCDADAHRYGTACRCCSAAEALGEPARTPAR